MGGRVRGRMFFRIQAFVNLAKRHGHKVLEYTSLPLATCPPHNVVPYSSFSIIKDQIPRLFQLSKCNLRNRTKHEITTGPIHTEAVCPRDAADSCTNHLQSPPITTQSPLKWSSNHLPITSLHRRRQLTDRGSTTSRTLLLNEFRPQEFLFIVSIEGIVKTIRAL